MIQHIVKPVLILSIGMVVLGSRVSAQEAETSYDISNTKEKLAKGIVATYKGGEISEKEWKDFLARTPWYQKGSPLHPEDLSWKHKLIKEYAQNKIFMEEAVKDKLDQSEDYKNAYDNAEANLMLRAMMEHEIGDKSKPTEEAMKNYYDEHKEDLASKETFSIRHIFVDMSSTKRKTAAERAEGLKKINEAYHKLQQGESFESVAKEYSETEPDKRGQINGPYERGIILKSIEDTALSLEPGHYSSVMTTKHGYNIIYLEEHKRAFLNPYKDVKEQISRILQGKKIPSLQEALANRALKAAKAVKHYEYINDSTASPMDTLVGLEGYKMTVGEFDNLVKQATTRPTMDQMTSYLNRLIQTKAEIYLAKELKYDKDSTVINGLQEFRENQLPNIWLNKKINEQIKISDADVKDFYEKNTARFMTQSEIYARNIYIRIAPTDPTSQADVITAMRMAKDTADWIISQVKKGEDFAELAKKYSDIPNAKDGGLIGWVHMGPMGHRFDTEAFKLKPGEISEPIPMQDGYQIVKVEQKKEPQQMTFEEAKDRARQGAEGEMRNKLKDKIVNETLKNKKFKYDFSRL